MERQISRRRSGEAQADEHEVEAELERVPYIADKRSTFFRQAGYTSPEDVANADPADLVSEVYGVGPKTAERVLTGARELLREEEPDRSDEVPEAELTEQELTEAKEAHRYSEPQAVTDLKGEARDQARDVDQSGVPLEAVEDLDGSTLDLGDDDERATCRYCQERFQIHASFRTEKGEPVCDRCAEDIDRQRAEEEAEAERTPEVTADEFQSRLMTREGGTEFWYRDPETGALITPYEAPGFENWCDERGHDPEDFQ